MLTLRRKSAANSRWTYYSSADNGDTESTYNYDTNGNRDFGEDSVGAGNRLAFDNTWSYSYDNEGNLIKRVNITETEDAGLTWTYDYDNANHLTVAKEWNSDPDENEEAALLLEADYAYDVFGNRIQKTVDWDGDGEGTATVEKYAYDGWNNLKSSSPVGNENWDIWADLDDAGSLATRYVRGDLVDQLFARVADNGDTLWNLTDHLGSLRDVIDNDGNVLDTINYSAFGQVDESDPEYGGRYKWTGREFDVETGLQFNRARYYDADTGRWISQDPLGFDAGDSNLYRYVANRPAQLNDPSGKQGLYGSASIDPAWIKKVEAWFIELEKENKLNKQGWLPIFYQPYGWMKVNAAGQISAQYKYGASSILFDAGRFSAQINTKTTNIGILNHQVAGIYDSQILGKYNFTIGQGGFKLGNLWGDGKFAYVNYVDGKAEIGFKDPTTGAFELHADKSLHVNYALQGGGWVDYNKGKLTAFITNNQYPGTGLILSNDEVRFTFTTDEVFFVAGVTNIGGKAKASLATFIPIPGGSLALAGNSAGEVGGVLQFDGSALPNNPAGPVRKMLNNLFSRFKFKLEGGYLGKKIWAVTVGLGFEW